MWSGINYLTKPEEASYNSRTGELLLFSHHMPYATGHTLSENHSSLHSGNM